MPPAPKIQTPEDFLAQTRRDENGCLIWTGTIHKRGYGRVSYRGRTDGAHRWSWRLFKGPIPKGLHVLHTCDVKPCVEPDHLFLGTQLDNMRDMIAKGRQNYYQRPRQYSDLTIQAICLMRELGATYSRIGDDLGVARSTACQVVNGKHYADVLRIR